jgi:hypothetical protein
MAGIVSIRSRPDLPEDVSRSLPSGLDANALDIGDVLRDQAAEVLDERGVLTKGGW